MSDHAHFEGKSAFEHLKSARLKGKIASSEIHGEEPSGHFIAACDSAKEVAIYLSLVWMLLTPFSLTLSHHLLLLSLFSLGLIIWKTTRSALLGWSRLERLHRLIEQERWEIEHHRAQEKEELIEMYAAKGFKGKQLDDIINVLMADDNRLLMVMLEEELGLSIESFEHPLKQSLGALIGSLCSVIFCFIGMISWGLNGLLIATFILLIATGYIASKALKNYVIKGFVWNVSISFLTLGTVYFLSRFLFKIFKV